MRRVNSFLAAVRTAYLEQGQTGRILLTCAFLVSFCCLCAIMSSVLFPLVRTSSNPVASPIVLPTQETRETPTSLFVFASLTPFPTSTSFAPTVSDH